MLRGFPFNNLFAIDVFYNFRLSYQDSDNPH